MITLFGAILNSRKTASFVGLYDKTKIQKYIFVRPPPRFAFKKTHNVWGVRNM